MSVQAVPTGRDIELPSMPRTSDDVLTQCPLGERTTRVGTDPVQRVECSIYVEDGDDSARHDEFTSFTAGNVRNAGNSMTTQSKDSSLNYLC